MPVGAHRSAAGSGAEVLTGLLFGRSTSHPTIAVPQSRELSGIATPLWRSSMADVGCLAACDLRMFRVSQRGRGRRQRGICTIHVPTQRYTEGNRGQHEMCPEQVKSLLPGTQHSFGCGLITRRSQVQILPPRLEKYQLRGPFRDSGRASDVVGNGRHEQTRTGLTFGLEPDGPVRRRRFE